jgi:putative ABC transport system permease protein
MFLAWRDLLVARGRFVLVGIVIALVALLTTMLSGLATGLVHDGISGLEALPLTHLAFQPGADAVFSRSTLTDANLAPWEQRLGKDSSPVGVSFFNAKRADGTTIGLALFGVRPDGFLAPTPDRGDTLGDGPGLVLSDAFEEEGVNVGDELTIVGVDRTVPVVGFTEGGSYGHVDIAFSSLGTWQELVFGDNARGRFSAVALKVPEGTSDADLERIQAASETGVVTKVDAYQGSPGFTAETSTMDLIRGFLLLISALIVGAFFTVWTIQRTRQIGLLKALGATNGYVVRDSLGQLAVILLGATLVGVAIALGLGSLVGSGVPFSLEPAPVAVSAAALVVLGMAGSLVALRRITSVDPVVAMAADH